MLKNEKNLMKTHECTSKNDKVMRYKCFSHRYKITLNVTNSHIILVYIAIDMNNMNSNRYLMHSR